MANSTIGTAGEEASGTTRTERLNTAYIYAISLVAALGGLLFGYDWVVIGGAKPFYEKYFGLTDPSQQGWAMSCALVGCLVGALVSGWLSDRFGRKRLLIAAGLVFAISSVALADHGWIRNWNGIESISYVYR
jgi:MFS transporter, SP family, xylose:H+ symportor